MHEFSICQTIVNSILEQAGKADPPVERITKTRIKAGELRQLVRENLEFAYEHLTRDTIAEGSKLEIEIMPIEGLCRDCRWQGLIDSKSLSCGSCGSVRMDIQKGRELELTSMEVE